MNLKLDLTFSEGPCESALSMISFSERLKALRPRNWNRSHSQVDETNRPWELNSPTCYCWRWCRSKRSSCDSRMS